MLVLALSDMILTQLLFKYNLGVFSRGLLTTILGSELTELRYLTPHLPKTCQDWSQVILAQSYASRGIV